MKTSTVSILSLRKELRASMGDRSRLSKLHSVVTDSINDSYGEEKQVLVTFRQEVKDALNCRLFDAR